MKQLFKAGKLPARQQGCFLVPRAAEELYDLHADPHALTNLASDREHARTLERLRTTLDDWTKRTGDRVPDSPTPDRFDRNTGKRLK